MIKVIQSSRFSISVLFEIEEYAVRFQSAQIHVRIKPYNQQGALYINTKIVYLKKLQHVLVY
jgi:hypothetical protein